MTSVSGASAMAFKSPLERLQTELQSQATSGTVKSADVNALSAALDSIDSVMKQGPSAESGQRSGRPSPTEMTDKINSLIDDQVSSGKLTSDQADELKGVFAAAMPSGGPGGPGGPGGAGGPPPGPPPDGAEGTDRTSSSDSTDSSDLLSQLLEMLQQAQEKSTTYAANGTSASQLKSVSLILNYES